jgi:hypothetical protein
VLHPFLDITGILQIGGKSMAVKTATGERYALHVASSTQVTAGQAHLAVSMGDVPPGTHLHVTGTAESNGEIAAQTVLAHLTSVSLRGTVTEIGSGTLTVSVGSAPVRAIVGREATVWQGSRALGPADIVIGDDVTVEGYQGKDVVLARKLLVHRRLVGIDGVVQTTSATGFTMIAQTGTVQVLVGQDTQLSGVVAVGGTVHVTGYRRGDGVILATRVRPKM